MISIDIYKRIFTLSKILRLEHLMKEDMNLLETTPI